jgi:hypothetical protein
MTFIEIDKANLLIAMFMVWTKSPYPNLPNKVYKGNLGLSIDQMQYHKSWEHLMPVIEKIESIEDSYHGHFGVHIVSNSCTIQATNFRPDQPIPDPPHYFNCVTLDSKLESTYLMIVRFIKWYNKQTKA